jgi:hypothetical protein
MASFKTPPKGSSSRKGKALPLEQMIQALQDLGYKITPASSEEDRKKQELSLKALGLVQEGRKPPPESKHKKLIATLHCQHVLNGQSYGPGPIELEPDQVGLFQALLHQEQAYKMEFYNIKEYRSATPTYLIQQSPRSDRMVKIAISPDQLMNLEAFSNLARPAVMAGELNAAGYALPQPPLENF